MLFIPTLGDPQNVTLNLETIVVAVIATAISGAAATVITLRVGIARMEEKMEGTRLASDARAEELDRRMTEGFEAFTEVARSLRDAVGRLTETVSKHTVYVDGMNDIYNRLRAVETDVAVLKDHGKS